MKRGQGTFEYVLLLGGVLLIVVLAVVVLQGIGRSSTAQASLAACNLKFVQSSSCYTADGSWNPGGTFNISSKDCVALENAKNAGTCVVDSFICTCPAAPPTG